MEITLSLQFVVLEPFKGFNVAGTSFIHFVIQTSGLTASLDPTAVSDSMKLCVFNCTDVRICACVYFPASVTSPLTHLSLFL